MRSAVTPLSPCLFICHRPSSRPSASPTRPAVRPSRHPLLLGSGPVPLATPRDPSRLSARRPRPRLAQVVPRARPDQVSHRRLAPLRPRVPVVGVLGPSAAARPRQRPVALTPSLATVEAVAALGGGVHAHRVAGRARPASRAHGLNDGPTRHGDPDRDGCTRMSPRHSDHTPNAGDEQGRCPRAHVAGRRGEPRRHPADGSEEHTDHDSRHDATHRPDHGCTRRRQRQRNSAHNWESARLRGSSDRNKW